MKTPAARTVGNRWCAAPPKSERQLMEARMFVAIAQFSQVPTEREEDFEAWFVWSNDRLRSVDGLEGRRLLRTADGTYAALVEHESAATFATMQVTEVAWQVHSRLREVLGEEPQATTYEVVANLVQPGSCCGGSDGHQGQGGRATATVGLGADLLVSGGCCRGA